MKIKLLSREVEINKVNGNANDLSPRNRGISFSYTRKISILKNEVSFNSLLHEIKHLYSTGIGIGQLEAFDHEVDCDMFASCIEQLILENGDDIFSKLKKFAEK